MNKVDLDKQRKKAIEMKRAIVEERRKFNDRIHAIQEENEKNLGDDNVVISYEDPKVLQAEYEKRLAKFRKGER